MVVSVASLLRSTCQPAEDSGLAREDDPQVAEAETP